MNELEYRVQLRAFLIDRLGRNPDAMQIPSPSLDIFIVRNFLDEEDCLDMIDLIERTSRPSTLLTAPNDPDFRTSYSSDVHPQEAVVERIEGKFEALMGVDPKQSETIQGQRYEVGQQFKPHYDYFHPTEPYWEDVSRHGGQRTWTAMVFLNDVPGGGETFFEHAAVKVTPRRGNLLAWNNMNSVGEPNRFALHQGLPVAAGTKYIITKWYRERTWLPADVKVY